MIVSGNLRWRIVAFLFFATTINYIDRQVIGILKPFIAKDLGWNESDYGYIAPVIVSAITVAYGWQWTFIITGTIGFVWVVVWLAYYHLPEKHPKLSNDEFHYIIQDSDDSNSQISMGTYAQDQGPRGKVIDYRIPIEIENVRVNPGDIVYGDCDGVVIVPSKIHRKVFNKAIEKGRGEKLVKKALEDGMSTVDAFEKYGIM